MIKFCPRCGNRMGAPEKFVVRYDTETGEAIHWSISRCPRLFCFFKRTYDEHGKLILRHYY